MASVVGGPSPGSIQREFLQEASRREHQAYKDPNSPSLAQCWLHGKDSALLGSSCRKQGAWVRLPLPGRRECPFF